MKPVTSDVNLYDAFMKMVAADPLNLRAGLVHLQLQAAMRKADVLDEGFSVIGNLVIRRSMGQEIEYSGEEADVAEQKVNETVMWFKTFCSCEPV